MVSLFVEFPKVLTGGCLITVTEPPVLTLTIYQFTAQLVASDKDWQWQW